MVPAQCNATGGPRDFYVTRDVTAAGRPAAVTSRVFWWKFAVIHATVNDAQTAATGKMPDGIENVTKATVLAITYRNTRDDHCHQNLSHNKTSKWNPHWPTILVHNHGEEDKAIRTGRTGRGFLSGVAVCIVRERNFFPADGLNGLTRTVAYSNCKLSRVNVRDETNRNQKVDLH
jgi:hypothetical protein